MEKVNQGFSTPKIEINFFFFGRQTLVTAFHISSENYEACHWFDKQMIYLFRRNKLTKLRDAIAISKSETMNKQTNAIFEEEEKILLISSKEENSPP